MVLLLKAPLVLQDRLQNVLIYYSISLQLCVSFHTRKKLGEQKNIELNLKEWILQTGSSGLCRNRILFNKIFSIMSKVKQITGMEYGQNSGFGYPVNALKIHFGASYPGTQRSCYFLLFDLNRSPCHNSINSNTKLHNVS